MKVNVVTAKRFNSVFKQLIGYRKHNDLRECTLKIDLFYESGVGLREDECWVYPIEVCVFLLHRRLVYDNKLFKLDKRFYEINHVWLLKELEPYLFEVKVNDRQYESLIMYISKHGEKVWEYMKESENAQCLKRFYKVLEGLKNKT